MKNAEAGRKTAVSSKLSDVSVGSRTSSVRSISKYSSRSISKQSSNFKRRQSTGRKNQDGGIDSWNRVYAEKVDFETASTKIEDCYLKIRGKSMER